MHSMEITVRAKAIRTMPKSTLNIYAEITNPEGIQHTVFGTIHYIQRDSTVMLRLSTIIIDEGNLDKQQ